MMTKDIFKNLILPSDDEVKRETKSVKTSTKLTGRKRPDQSNRVSGKKNPMAGKTSPNKGKSMPQISEKIKGVKKPAGFGEKISQRRKELGLGNTMGGKKRPEHSERMKEHNPGIEKTQVAWKCQHCGLEGVGSSNYSRWHGDNCKQNLFNDLVLPSDDEIKRETQYKKIGLASSTRKPSVTTKNKMSESHKKNWEDPTKHKERCEVNKKSRTDEVRKKISKGLTGIERGVRTEEHKQKLSNALKGIPKTKFICPHCNKSGAGPVMKRFHFDNCKHK